MKIHWYIPAQVISIICLALGLFGISTGNSIMAFIGAALWVYIKAEAENTRRTKEMKQKIEVYERYIEKYHIETKA